VVEPHAGSDEFDRVLTECLDSNELSVIIARRPCVLIAKQLKQYECDAKPETRNPKPETPRTAS
jgi:TPP-dependent indolepyruvate ferredoxin oxidoreductase alpha subunit